MSTFAVLTATEWPLGSTVEAERKARLVGGTPFEDIVRSLLSNHVLVRAVADPVPEGQTGHRFFAQFCAAKDAVDMFFNSVSGYRAQYLYDEHLGDAANRYVVDALMPKVLETVRLMPVSRKLPQIAEASLAHPWAKVWVHQGAWLRRSRRVERVLLVPPWQAELASQDKLRRKLARWGSLAPEETRFILKGGYVHSGTHLMTGKSAAFRRSQIHSLGFT